MINTTTTTSTNMSSDTTSTAVKLSIYTIAEWKNNLITKALEFSAYGILMGTESPPAPSETRATESYNSRQSKLAGYIRGTLDIVQITTILNGVDILDIPTIYAKLLSAYESKTSASRISILQELVSLRKKNDETFEQYGSHAIELASRLVAQLPAGPKYTPEIVKRVDVKYGTGDAVYTTTYNHIENGKESSYVAGYTAENLAQQLALSMIPIGLGDSELDRFLRNMLNHLDKSSSDSNSTLEHLKCALTLSRNVAMMEGTTAATLAASTKKAKFHCSHPKHGDNSTHDTKDCRIIAYNKAKKSKDSAKSAENSSLVLLSAEQAMMAAISHIKSPTVHCSHHSHRPKPTANDPWNPDTGASKHMTSTLQ